MKKITVKEYAELRGITTYAVINRLSRNLPLPAVKSAKKIGRDWRLSVDINALEQLSITKDPINRIFV